jgi:hypothetical protein
VRGSGANLPEGVVSAIEGLWDMSRTPNCAGVRFQYPDFQGIERSTCPSWPLPVQLPTLNRSRLLVANAFRIQGSINRDALVRP